MNTIDLIHHDGSELYVRPQTPKIGDVVTLRLRIPADVSPEKIILRVPVDAEPRTYEAVRESGSSEWWSATVVMSASRLSYRWLIVGGKAGYIWVTAAGNLKHEVTDNTDFQLTSFAPIVDWATKSVAYQIFPDRFAPSTHTYEVPSWAVKRDWSLRPEGRSRNTGVEYFGGDLWGIIDKLDHIQDLGVNLIYTTPFFPARSTHRYDASTFAHVDPLLGGDEALIALAEAAHARGMRVIGDITLNHTGETHEWFRAALAGDELKRGYYYFDGSIPDGYVSWLGHKSLPKLNFASQALREELISGTNSVLRKYLKAPFNLDGWRVDVANMMARLGDFDANHEIARLTRWAVEQEGSEKILIAEHNHNAGPDLPGDGWSGNMNYTSFQRPVWYWLADESAKLEFISGVPVRSTTTETFIESVKTGHAALPWKSLISSWNLLGSHDSARVRTMVGSRDRQEAAAYLMCTLPGTPMIFAEDEIGAQGRLGEDARTAFPWHSPETWDTDILKTYQSLISLRTYSEVLAKGGMRFVDRGANHIAFIRENEKDALLVVVAREDSFVDLDLKSFGFSEAELVLGAKVLPRQSQTSIKMKVPTGGSIWRLV